MRLEFDLSNVPSDTALLVTRTDEWLEQAIVSLSDALNLDQPDRDLFGQDVVGAVAASVDRYLKH